MAMLCACSGEQRHFDEMPQSPDSLATRDYSVSGLSSRIGDGESKMADDSQVDDIESTLKETLSLNYEEARALLGRLEYQRGNFDAALQVFQGIDIHVLKPRMVKAIAERTRARKPRSKGGRSSATVMSMHSVMLLLEAILLKTKSLEGLGRIKDAAMECKTILDIVESAWPHGMPQVVEDGSKLKEILHKALELHPRLWKAAGFLEEAISAYRRALIKPWNLDPITSSNIQKDLAGILLYGGVEVPLPLQLQQVWGSTAPKTNLEEAIFLLFILMGKVAFQEISWDPEIMDHLTFALSLSGHFEFLAYHVEQMLPGINNRVDRWYSLALCYTAAGKDDIALNVLRKALGQSETRREWHLPSILLGSKLCSNNKLLASEGINFAQRAIKSSEDQENHFMGLVSRLLGVCYGSCARMATSDSQRRGLQKEAVKALQNAAILEKDEPEVIYGLGMELALQRNLNAAREVAAKYVDMTCGSSFAGWRLLTLVVSAEQKLKEAEAVASLAIGETGNTDQLEVLKLKAQLQVAQEQPRNAIETYRVLLSTIQAQQEFQRLGSGSEVKQAAQVELDVWTDLAQIYAKLGLWRDSNVCLEKAKSLKYFSPECWHEAGKVSEAQSLHKEALSAFFMALSIDPDYVPSMVSTAVVLRTLGGASLPVGRSLLTNALRLDPNNHEAWLNLGLIHKSEGSLQQAADCFQAAYGLKESSPVANFI